MKEKEFLKELKEMGFEDGIKIPIYFGFDGNKNVILDEVSIKEAIRTRLRELREILD